MNARGFIRATRLSLYLVFRPRKLAEDIEGVNIANVSEQEEPRSVVVQQAFIKSLWLVVVSGVMVVGLLFGHLVVGCARTNISYTVESKPPRPRQTPLPL